MIKNIIFDMGRVLIDFDPEVFLDREGITDQEVRQVLLKHIFKAPEWAQMDLGTLAEDEFEEKLRTILPTELHDVMHRLVSHWSDDIIPVPGMADFVKECKEKGYHIYLLSNASIRQRQYWPLIPGHEYFEGTVISAEEKVVKPDPKIYQILLERYHLKAEESVFIDDLPVNIEGANSVGIEGILFDRDVEKLRKRF